ncbi:hypothetical protein VNI00_010494 [Paramarasmius palmivorus]|uniref:Uncharacterized protein n=1 Tax=Paramarasmius palmivorus TaxID=297713 RepID=A0AAW0CKC8_9AGAR
MPPIFLKGRGSSFSSPPESPSTQQTEANAEPLNSPSRSPSPALSNASSADSESAVRALWNAYFKHRVFVRVHDGWTCQWLDSQSQAGDSEQSDANTGVEASTEEDSVGQLLPVSSKEDPVVREIAEHPENDGSANSPFIGTPHDAPKGRTTEAASKERKRLQDRQHKFRDRLQKGKVLRAKQNGYAARYRAKNREKLRVKAQEYRRTRTTRSQNNTASKPPTTQVPTEQQARNPGSQGSKSSGSSRPKKKAGQESRADLQREFEVASARHDEAASDAKKAHSVMMRAEQALSELQMAAGDTPVSSEEIGVAQATYEQAKKTWQELSKNASQLKKTVTRLNTRVISAFGNSSRRENLRSSQRIKLRHDEDPQVDRSDSESDLTDLDELLNKASRSERPLSPGFPRVPKKTKQGNSASGASEPSTSTQVAGVAQPPLPLSNEDTSKAPGPAEGQTSPSSLPPSRDEPPHSPSSRSHDGAVDLQEPPEEPVGSRSPQSNDKAVDPPVPRQEPPASPSHQSNDAAADPPVPPLPPATPRPSSPHSKDGTMDPPADPPASRSPSPSNDDACDSLGPRQAPTESQDDRMAVDEHVTALLPEHHQSPNLKSINQCSENGSVKVDTGSNQSTQKENEVRRDESDVESDGEAPVLKRLSRKRKKQQVLSDDEGIANDPDPDTNLDASGSTNARQGASPAREDSEEPPQKKARKKITPDVTTDTSAPTKAKAKGRNKRKSKGKSKKTALDPPQSEPDELEAADKPGLESEDKPGLEAEDKPARTFPGGRRKVGGAPDEESLTSQTKARIEKIRSWLKEALKGTGPASITVPSSHLGVRTLLYETAAILPELATTSRAIALAAITSAEGNVICRFHTRNNKSIDNPGPVDGDLGMLHGRPWPFLHKDEKSQLVNDQEDAKKDPDSSAPADPRLINYNGDNDDNDSPGWVRVDCRDPNATECGCVLQDVLLDLWLWKTGKITSYTSKLVDNWRADFLTPRQRALVCAQYREASLLDIDDLYSYGVENGRWVKRDELYIRRIQAQRAQKIVDDADKAQARKAHEEEVKGDAAIAAAAGILADAKEVIGDE